jgi:hypothetical protein
MTKEKGDEGFKKKQYKKRAAPFGTAQFMLASGD